MGIQCRAVTSNYDNETKCSEWSDIKYFVTQPKVTSIKNNGNSVTVKFKKIAGAKSYTVYARKHNLDGSKGKWSKAKTITSNKITVSKIRKKKVNTNKAEYDICVVANAKVKGKTVTSSKYAYYLKFRYLKGIHKSYDTTKKLDDKTWELQF